MGRYAAPLDDEDDPMDWTPTPDEDAHRRDARSLTCVDPRFDDYGQGRSDDWRDDGGGRCPEHAAEACHLEIEADRTSAKKARARRTALVTALATVACLAFRRHAPPPPPLWVQSPYAVSSISADPVAPYASEGAPPTLDITQHDSWAGYLQHALSYGLSVAWYATSNAFCYTMEELRDGGMELLRRHGNTIEESVASMQRLWDAATEIYRRKRRGDVVPDADTMPDSHRRDDEALQRILFAGPCPIRLPSASALHRRYVSRDATAHAAATAAVGEEEPSSEDVLRRTVGASLSPQNLAIQRIAAGLEAWALSASPDGRCAVDETPSGRALPPAAGFLLAGPTGTGKSRAARRVADLLFGHCSRQFCESSDSGTRPNLEGVLEIMAGDDDGNGSEEPPAKRWIVDHLRSRGGLGGSVVIIHHVESLPRSVLMDISQVLSGNTDTLSYRTPDSLVSATCNGTVFVLTSHWGSQSVFQHTQRDVLTARRRESLTSFIAEEFSTASATQLAKVSVFMFARLCVCFSNPFAKRLSAFERNACPAYHRGSVFSLGPRRPRFHLAPQNSHLAARRPRSSAEDARGVARHRKACRRKRARRVYKSAQRRHERSGRRSRFRLFCQRRPRFGHSSLLASPSDRVGHRTTTEIGTDVESRARRRPQRDGI